LKLRFVSDVGFEILNLSAPADRFVSCNLLFGALYGFGFILSAIGTKLACLQGSICATYPKY